MDPKKSRPVQVLELCNQAEVMPGDSYQDPRIQAYQIIYARILHKKNISFFQQNDANLQGKARKAIKKMCSSISSVSKQKKIGIYVFV